MLLLIGKKFIVARGPSDFPTGERLPILLAIGRAFGSGEHETTRSCLEELEGIPVLPTTRVLDLGSGTGILAVAAARLGARSVIALDSSPDAFETTLATIRLNGLQEIVTSLQGEIEIVKDRRFELIMANLYGDILLRLLEAITKLLEPGGYLLLSGILYEDAYDVKARFARAGCTLLKARYLDEYSTLILTRKPNTVEASGRSFRLNDREFHSPDETQPS